MLSTPQYQIRKDKKSGLLVSPSKVTVVVDQDTVELEDDVPAHTSTGSGQQEVFIVSHHSADEFVSKQDFDLLSNQLEEKFARFEALLTRTNIFSTPKVPVSTITVPVSEQPFFNPSDPRGTGPVRSPGLDEEIQVDKPKEKKNKGSGKTKGKKAKTVPSATITTKVPVPEKPQTSSLKIAVPLNPTKVDMPGPGVFTSLGQVSATSSTRRPLLTFNQLLLPVIPEPVRISHQLKISLMSTLSPVGPTKTLRMERFLIQRLKSKMKK